MKIFNNKISVIVLFFACMFSLVGLTRVMAATTPSLGASVTYGVLSNIYANSSAATVVNGDIGFTTAPAAAPGGTHTYYGSGGLYTQAGTD